MSLGTMLHIYRSFLSLIFVFAWFSCFTFRPVKAQTTIDDAQSAFSFASTWNAVTPSDPCDGCAFKPDASDIFDGTWHDGSVAGSTGSLTFEGTGVSLFGVANGAQTCAMTFVLDGTTSSLDLSAIPQSTVSYNYQYFTQGGLSSGSHSLSWTIETSVVNAVALIDYAVVTSAAAAANTVVAATAGTNSGSSTFSSSEGVQTITVTGPSSASNTQSSLSSSNAGSLTSFSQSNTSSSTNSAAVTSGSPTTGSLVSETAVVITVGTSLITSMVISSSTSTPASAVLLAPQKPKTAIIVGAVLGSVLGVVLVFALLFLILRRRRRSKPPSSTPFYYNSQLDADMLREERSLQRVYPPEKVAHISRAPSRINTQPPSPETSSPSTVMNESTVETSTSPENSSVEPSVGPFQHMEQRILLLERILRQTNQEEIMLHDTSPPPPPY